MPPSAPKGSLLAAARAAGHGPDSLAADRRRFERAEAAVAALAAAGRHDDAIQAAEAAATLAGQRHPGRHASARLEALLCGIGAERLAALPARDVPAQPERILHVVTEVYPVGGHTRVLWRWIARDAQRAHFVVLTTQRPEVPVPAGLIEAVRASGGDVIGLRHDGAPLERAGAIRELAGQVDRVVVHAHPHDPLPVVALGGCPNRPPCVFFNHGDHLFWLGTAVADALHCSRRVGARIAAERRGIAADRCVVAPFPVSGGDGHAEPLDAAAREAARAAILAQRNWPADTVLLLSVGTPYKFRGAPGAELLDLVDPLLRGDSRARLVVVGVHEDAAWAAATRSGRIALVPPRAELAPLLGAADVYLESRPLGGPAASGEAAAHALPVLTHAATPLEAVLFTTDPEYGVTRTTTPGEYRRTLARLIARAADRTASGRAARERIAAADAGWPVAVEKLYARAAQLGPASVPDATLAPASPVDDDLDSLVAFTGTLHAPLPDRQADLMAAGLDLASRSETVRECFGSLVDVVHGAQRTLPMAFAAPVSDPVTLRAVIDVFRSLHATRAADRLVLALRPDQADAAIPVLEDAIRDELDVDLLLDSDPDGLCPPDALLVCAGGELVV